MLLLEVSFDREKCRPGVERIENCLDEQNVRAAVEQATDLIGVGNDQFIVSDAARGGIVYVSRNRGSPRRWAERAGHETGATGLCGHDGIGGTTGAFGASFA